MSEETPDVIRYRTLIHKLNAAPYHELKCSSKGWELAIRGTGFDASSSWFCFDNGRYSIRRVKSDDLRRDAKKSFGIDLADTLELWEEIDD